MFEKTDQRFFQMSSSRGEGLLRKNPHDPKFVEDFLAHLVAKSLLDSSAAERAQQAYRKTRQRIDVVISELGLITEPQLLNAYSELYGLQVVMPASYPLEPILADKLSAEFLIRNRVLPIALDAENLIIATPDPFAIDTIRSIAYFADVNVEMRLGSARSIEACLKQLYEKSGVDRPEGEDEIDAVFVNDDDLQRLRDIASEAPVIRLVNRLISNAAALGASDIHIEPMVDAVRVRYRIDGLTSEVDRLAPEFQAGVATRIKILAKLNIAERRLPQDGRAKFVFGGREIDLRVSTSPVLHGESVVLRLLDQQEVPLSFAALGFDQDNLNKFEALLALPSGIILVTGPTGSGKTTTLYTALKKLNSVERTIFSVEDPIEYQLPGINQIQIKPDIGLDFADCLRSILRQDPDVIMVGEMRDPETMRIGIQASLTGHLVLSTLHTNSAAAAITRLLDMGAQGYLLGSTIAGILAQRLVRRLCQCARPAENSAALLESLDAVMPSNVKMPSGGGLRVPSGCTTCNGTGYKGRTTIIELLTIDNDLRRLIKDGILAFEIEAAAQGNGMETLYQCGIRKALAGETSLDEVLRMTRHTFG